MLLPFCSRELAGALLHALWCELSHPCLGQWVSVVLWQPASSCYYFALKALMQGREEGKYPSC